MTSRHTVEGAADMACTELHYYIIPSRKSNKTKQEKRASLKTIQ